MTRILKASDSKPGGGEQKALEILPAPFDNFSA